MVIDEDTKNRRLLISLRKLFKIFWWEGWCYAFNVEAVYGKQPLYSANCGKVGHNLHQYNKIITN